MANASPHDAVPCSTLNPFSVASANLPFSSSLCIPLGFSRWADETSPYCNLDTTSSVLESSLTSAHDTPISPPDMKCEIEEGLIQDLEPKYSHLNGGRCSQSHTGPLRLDSLDLIDLSQDEVLFYFGVLAMQKLLLSNFHTTNSEEGGSPGVTLTMYGHTITRLRNNETPEQAKVEVCREALDKFKSEYPEWVVPNVAIGWYPGPDWNWCELLHVYCLCNGLDLPKFRKYVHEKGYRHEVEIEGVTYVGALQSYPEESESQNATAFKALHESLVSVQASFCNALGPLTLEQSYKQLLRPTSKIPSHTEGQPRPNIRAKARVNNEPKAIRKRARARKKRLIDAKRCNNIQSPMNANFQPVLNSRIEPVGAPLQEERGRWPVSLKKIKQQLAGVKPHTERLQKICHLLCLDYPDIQIRGVNEGFTDGMRHYHAAAFFPNDPFLARVGVIGEVSITKGTCIDIQEMCAERVARYLVDMVREDTVLEHAQATVRYNREQWGARALKRMMAKGLIRDAMQIDQEGIL